MMNRTPTVDAGPFRSASRGRVSFDVRQLLSGGRVIRAATALCVVIGNNDSSAMDQRCAGSDRLAWGSRAASDIPASATALVGRLEAAGHPDRNSQVGDRRRISSEPTRSATAEVVAVLAPLIDSIDRMGATPPTASIGRSSRGAP